MKPMAGRQQYFAATFLGAVILGTAPIGAQEGGLTAALTLTPGLLYEDEELRTSLGFSTRLDATTRNQSFMLDFSGALESGRGGSFSDSLREPRLGLSYSVESRQSALETNLSYRNARISSLGFVSGLGFADDLTNEFLFIGDGRREDLDVSTALSFGREASFGGTLDLGYQKLTYLDTTDPTLQNEETLSAGGTLRFEINQRSTITLTGLISETKVQDTGLDQRNESLSIGIEQAVSPTLSISTSIGTSRITDTVGGLKTTREGANYTLSAMLEQPNGTLSGRVASNITTGGRLSTARVERRIALPLGALSFALGVGQVDGSTAQPLANFSWQHEMPRATFSLVLDQELAVDRDGERAVNSQIGVNWQQELNSLSRLSAGLSLQETNRLDPGNPDSQQASLSVSFQRALTQDWTLRSSYTHRRSNLSDGSNSSEDTVFLGVERGFQWRP
jgi:hypothetical protein